MLRTLGLDSISRFRRAGWNDVLYRSVLPKPNVRVAIFGGYKGDSVAGWLSRLPDAVFAVFEPVPEFAGALRTRFPADEISIYEFGVSERQERRDFIIADDSSGTFVHSHHKASPAIEATAVQFEDTDTLRGILGQESWDVLEINIEGGEYELIELMANEDLLSRFAKIFVQFHRVGKGTRHHVRHARKSLARTHEQIWNYAMVWEHWELQK